mmetsp:Transcript_21605/g.46202  ORF Transcript_21605/g.46202 Transcript_21605/m.46202 type:complete len:224 (+) Transcript_21605:908-1579(+)
MITALFTATFDPPRFCCSFQAPPLELLNSSEIARRLKSPQLWLGWAVVAQYERSHNPEMCGKTRESLLWAVSPIWTLGPCPPNGHHPDSRTCSRWVWFYLNSWSVVLRTSLVSSRTARRTPHRQDACGPRSSGSSSTRLPVDSKIVTGISRGVSPRCAQPSWKRCERCSRRRSGRTTLPRSWASSSWSSSRQNPQQTGNTCSRRYPMQCLQKKWSAPTCLRGR